MSAAILNAGSGAWAFEALAENLSHAFGVPVSDVPADFNYLLAWEETNAPTGQCFVPFDAIECANDKRLIAHHFDAANVPCPTTHLLSDTELEPFLKRESSRRWLLKFPTGCGGAGHRFIQHDKEIPVDWPRPLVVQEFIAMARPEVLRLYGVAGELFGWNARRFPGEAPTVFVAHARGARYEDAGNAPDEAVEVARLALESTGLIHSFGCVDLVQNARGHWLALEVGTDGLWSHVDRDIALPVIADELESRLARAFENFMRGDAAS